MIYGKALNVEPWAAFRQDQDCQGCHTGGSGAGSKPALRSPFLSLILCFLSAYSGA
jgi:mono/diheme cytochrome c family protein